MHSPLDVPNLPLMHIDARGRRRRSLRGPAGQDIRELAESATHWHAYNEGGLYFIPFAELKYGRYFEDDCPALRDV